MAGNRYLYQELFNHTMMRSQPLLLKLEALNELEKEAQNPLNLEAITPYIINALKIAGLRSDAELDKINIRNINDIKDWLSELNAFFEANHENYLKNQEINFYNEYQKYLKALRYFEDSAALLLANSNPSPEDNPNAKRYLDQSKFASRMLLVDFNYQIPSEQKTLNLISRLRTAKYVAPKEQKEKIETQIDTLATQLDDAIFHAATAANEKKQAPAAIATDANANRSKVHRAAFRELLQFYPDEKGASLLVAENPPPALIEAKNNDQKAQEEYLTELPRLQQLEKEYRKKTAEYESKLAILKNNLDIIRDKIRIARESREAYIQAEIKATKEDEETVRARLAPEIEEDEQFLKQQFEKATQIATKKETELTQEQSNLDQAHKLALQKQETRIEESKRNATTCREKLERLEKSWEAAKANLDAAHTRATVMGKSRQAHPAMDRAINQIINDDEQLFNLTRTVTNPVVSKFLIISNIAQDDLGMYYGMLGQRYLLLATKLFVPLFAEKITEQGAFKRKDELYDIVHEMLEYQNIFQLVVAEYAWQIEHDIVANQATPKPSQEAKPLSLAQKQELQKAESNNKIQRAWILERIYEKLDEQLSKVDLQSKITYLSNLLSRIAPQEMGSDATPKSNPLQQSYEKYLQAKEALKKGSKNEVSIQQEAYTVALNNFNKLYNEACNTIKTYYWKTYEKNHQLPTFIDPRAILTKTRPALSSTHKARSEEKRKTSQDSDSPKSNAVVDYFKQLFKTKILRKVKSENPLTHFNPITLKHSDSTPKPKPPKDVPAAAAEPRKDKQ